MALYKFDFAVNPVYNLHGSHGFWKVPKFIFSGPEKSWNCTLVQKKSWFLSFVVLKNQITRLIFLQCDFHEVEVEMCQSQCTCIYMVSFLHLLHPVLLSVYLEGHKPYYNKSWFFDISSAERSWRSSEILVWYLSWNPESGSMNSSMESYHCRLGAVVRICRMSALMVACALRMLLGILFSANFWIVVSLRILCGSLRYHSSLFRFEHLVVAKKVAKISKVCKCLSTWNNRQRAMPLTCHKQE